MAMSASRVSAHAWGLTSSPGCGLTSPSPTPRCTRANPLLIPRLGPRASNPFMCAADTASHSSLHSTSATACWQQVTQYNASIT